MQIPIESLNLMMLNVGYARHQADWNWRDVSSPFTRIYYVKEGRARLHTHGALAEGSEQVVELRPGHLYIVPAHTPHSYECDGLFGHYYLHVYEGFKKETDVFERFDFPTEVPAHAGDEELLRQMCEQHPYAKLSDSDPRAYDNVSTFQGYVRRYNELPLHEKMQLRGAILILFSRFMAHATERIWTMDDRLTRVVRHIHNNIDDDISVDDLAEVACVTKPHLIRLFKRDFGLAPLQYINRKKVERAQLLLLTEEKSVKEVAYTLGFSDHSYFIRLFKKTTGKTPMEYLQMFH